MQHEEYNLTLLTTLTPLGLETYNSSFTIINYAPADKSGLTSLELVEFNSPITLSQQYTILGKVAEGIGEDYDKSGDKTLKQLAHGYQVMEKETRNLAKLVEKRLSEYNREIFNISAVLMDDFWSCLACNIGCAAAIGGGCALVCFLTVGLACEICIDLLGEVELLHLGCEAVCEYLGWCP